MLGVRKWQAVRAGRVGFWRTSEDVVKQKPL